MAFLSECKSASPWTVSLKGPTTLLPSAANSRFRGAELKCPDLDLVGCLERGLSAWGRDPSRGSAVWENTEPFAISSWLATASHTMSHAWHTMDDITLLWSACVCAANKHVRLVALNIAQRHLSLLFLHIHSWSLQYKRLLARRDRCETPLTEDRDPLVLCRCLALRPCFRLPRICQGSFKQCDEKVSCFGGKGPSSDGVGTGLKLVMKL